MSTPATPAAPSTAAAAPTSAAALTSSPATPAAPATQTQPTQGAAATTPTQPPADPKAAPAPAAPPAGDPAAPSDPAKAALATDRPAAEKLKLLRERQAFETERQTLQKAIEDERAKVEAMQKASAAELELAKAVKTAKASGNLANALSAAGFSADEIAAFLVNGAGGAAKPEVSPTEQKLAELEKQTQQLTKAEQERQESARKAAEQEARDEALAIIAEGKEALPWVNALGLGEQVITEMQAEFKKTGAMPDLEATAKAIEARTAAQMPAYIEKLVAFAPVKAVLEAALAKLNAAATPATAPAAASAQPAAEPEKKAEPQPTDLPKPGGFRIQRRTLSNDLSASPSAGGAPPPPKTADEIWRQAQAKFSATKT
jgi:hypothetical protein